MAAEVMRRKVVEVRPEVGSCGSLGWRFDRTLVSSMGEKSGSTQGMVTVDLIDWDLGEESITIECTSVKKLLGLAPNKSGTFRLI